jgi:hypothetical protein
MTSGLVLGALLAASAAVRRRRVAGSSARTGLDPERDRLANPDDGRATGASSSPRGARPGRCGTEGDSRFDHALARSRTRTNGRSRPPAPAARPRTLRGARPSRRRATADPSERAGADVADCTVTLRAELPRIARFCARVRAPLDGRRHRRDRRSSRFPPGQNRGAVPCDTSSRRSRRLSGHAASRPLRRAARRSRSGFLIVAIGYVLDGALLLGAGCCCSAAFGTAAAAPAITPRWLRVRRTRSAPCGPARGYAVEDARGPRGGPQQKAPALRALRLPARVLHDPTRRRATALLDLGEAVYRGDEEAGRAARDRVAALDREKSRRGTRRLMRW